jgi:hypothetical protein
MSYPVVRIDVVNTVITIGVAERSKCTAGEKYTVGSVRFVVRVEDVKLIVVCVAAELSSDRVLEPDRHKEAIGIYVGNVDRLLCYNLQHVLDSSS